jgi:hypothetical protein
MLSLALGDGTAGRFKYRVEDRVRPGEVVRDLFDTVKGTVDYVVVMFA